MRTYYLIEEDKRHCRRIKEEMKIFAGEELMLTEIYLVIINRVPPSPPKQDLRHLTRCVLANLKAKGLIKHIGRARYYFPEDFGGRS